MDDGGSVCFYCGRDLTTFRPHGAATHVGICRRKAANAEKSAAAAASAPTAAAQHAAMQLDSADESTDLLEEHDAPGQQEQQERAAAYMFASRADEEFALTMCARRITRWELPIKVSALPASMDNVLIRHGVGGD